MSNQIHTIVMPLHHSGGKYKTDTELRFALRSIEKHFIGAFEIVIIGKKIPHWMKPDSVTHIKHDGGLKAVLKAAAEKYPDGFFWWYDDLCMLRDAEPDELKITAAKKNVQYTATGWGQNLTKIYKRLEAEGYEPRDYSHPHGVYWFDKGMVDEGFRDWPGMKGRFPWESWILSKRSWPWRAGVVKQWYRPGFDPSDIDTRRHAFINYNGDGFTRPLVDWLEERLPDQSRFERVKVKAPNRNGTYTMEVHTLRFGDAWYITELCPSMDDWCARHGYPLKVWGKEDIDEKCPTAKFVIVQMIHDFLAGSSDWMMFVDADIYAHPGAGPFPDLSEKTGWIIRPDRPCKCSRGFWRWVLGNKFARLADNSWTYFNSGVWLCDRQGAQAFLDEVTEPYVVGVQEQHHVNWWLYQASLKGLQIDHLPKQWNAFYHEPDGTKGFYHFAGGRKGGKYEGLKKQGVLDIGPQGEVKEIEHVNFAYDATPYLYTRDGTNNAIDYYHAQLLFIAAGLQGEGIKAAEIGCYRGASTSALVEALNQGIISELHLFEPSPQPELRRLIAQCSAPEKIFLHTVSSWDKIELAVDFVFIDGDHRWAAFADVLHAQAWGAKVIAMHDTAAYANGIGAWGAWSAGQCLRRIPGWDHFEHAEKMDGQQTQRGFLVAACEGIDLGPLYRNPDNLHEAITEHAEEDEGTDETEEQDAA
jgi:Methyltransferase domain